MSRTRKLLVTAGLAGLLVTGVGTGAASAHTVPGEQSPRESGRSSADVRVVADRGLTAQRRVDSAPDLQSCYADATGWDAGFDDLDGDTYYLPAWDDSPDSRVGRVPVYLAEPDCNDVNLQITGGWTEGLQARVCFFPTSSGYYCNQWTPIAPGDSGWHLVATNVLDGTAFEVEFSDPGTYLTGAIAY